MSYNNVYKYDLFISYAHVDNTSDKAGNVHGWVTQFYRDLSMLLDRNIGKVGQLSVWWDDNLRKNERFDTVIENAIKNSAIFLSLTSNGYYLSEYCSKELKYFFNHALNNSTGLFVNDQSRLINIQQYKFAYQKWPDEFRGIGSYNFFELLNDQDKFGYPLDSSHPAFKNEMKLLARNLFELLSQIKESIKSPEPSPLPQSVYIGKVADTMHKTKVQLMRELEHLKIPVVKGDVPPPYPRDQHRAAVLKRLAQSDLSVHILDDYPGSEIESDGLTYLQEQILLAQEKKKPQLIFIPKQLDFDEIDNLAHRAFLKNLQDNKTDSDNYTLIRELSVSGMMSEIQEHLKPKVNEPKTADKSVFLDFHEVDATLAIEMSAFFFSQRVNTFMSINQTSPTETMKNFVSTLKEVNSLLIILGKVTKDWVRERLNKAIETILKEECPVAKLGIYIAPHVDHDGLHIRQRFLQIELLDDSKNDSFNPATILPFLTQ